MKKYEVISFDIFQTLVDVNERIPYIWQDVLGDDYSNEKAMQGAKNMLDGVSSLYEVACENFMTMEEFYLKCASRTIQNVGFELAPEAVSRSLMKQHGLAPYYSQVLEVVKDIKSDYSVIICSDASHEMADPIIDRIQPDQAFISDDLKCYKGAPNGEFFRIVLDKLQVSPDKILHIGDGIGDIRGAHLCGIDSCLVNRGHKKWTGDIVPNYEISQFDDLRKILSL